MLRVFHHLMLKVLFALSITLIVCIGCQQDRSITPINTPDEINPNINTISFSNVDEFTANTFSEGLKTFSLTNSADNIDLSITNDTLKIRGDSTSHVHFAQFMNNKLNDPELIGLNKKKDSFYTIYWKCLICFPCKPNYVRRLFPNKAAALAYGYLLVTGNCFGGLPSDFDVYDSN